jgi:hypothetical protein
MENHITQTEWENPTKEKKYLAATSSSIASVSRRGPVT